MKGRRTQGEELWSPDPPTETTEVATQLPSLPFPAFSLSFVILCSFLSLSLLGCLLQPTHSSSFSHLPKGPPKDSCGFRSFVTPESSKRSTSKRCSAARGREHSHRMCGCAVLQNSRPTFPKEQKTRSLPPPSPSSGGLWQDRGGPPGLTFPPRGA